MPWSCHRLQHAHTINKILSAHPNWKHSHDKRLSGLKDASSKIEWIGCDETNTCDLPKLWLLGREATGILELDENFFATQQNGITMIKPNKRCVGVTVDDERSEDLLSIYMIVKTAMYIFMNVQRTLMHH